MSRDIADMQTMGFRNEEDVRAYSDSNTIESLRQQLASRDAEIAALRLLVEQRQEELASCMRANSAKFDTIQRNDAEIATLREDMTLLRDALSKIVVGGEVSMADTDKYNLYVEVSKKSIKSGRKAIDATEPKT